MGNGIGKAKAYGHQTALCGSIPPARSGDNDIWIQGFSPNPFLNTVVSRLNEDYPEEYDEKESDTYLRLA